MIYLRKTSNVTQSVTTCPLCCTESLHQIRLTVQINRGLDVVHCRVSFGNVYPFTPLTYICRIKTFDYNREVTDYPEKTAFSSAYQRVGRLQLKKKRTHWVILCLFNKKTYLFTYVQLINLLQYPFSCAKCFITQHHFFSHRLLERRKTTFIEHHFWHLVSSVSSSNVEQPHYSKQQ